MLTFKIASELVTLHTETLILPAIILRIVSLHDLSAIAALDDHWLLGWLKEP